KPAGQNRAIAAGTAAAAATPRCAAAACPAASAGKRCRIPVRSERSSLKTVRATATTAAARRRAS
ncbi:MAG: hypothetical protein R3D69_18970, partial [Xanthobacteraceae bacterium]